MLIQSTDNVKSPQPFIYRQSKRCKGKGFHFIMFPLSGVHWKKKRRNIHSSMVEVLRPISVGLCPWISAPESTVIGAFIAKPLKHLIDRTIEVGCRTLIHTVRSDGARTASWELLMFDCLREFGSVTEVVVSRRESYGFVAVDLRFSIRGNMRWVL